MDSRGTTRICEKMGHLLAASLSSALVVYESLSLLLLSRAVSDKGDY
jgi:hypothetical protein